MNKFITSIGLLLILTLLLSTIYKVGYKRGVLDELAKWKSAEVKAIQDQKVLVDSLNKKINLLEGELNSYIDELDRVKELNDEKIKNLEDDNTNNDCIINGNLNRLHDSFTSPSN